MIHTKMKMFVGSDILYDLTLFYTIQIESAIQLKKENVWQIIPNFFKTKKIKKQSYTIIQEKLQ